MANIKSELDALFAVPLSEFTPARNALARRLEGDRLSNEAATVKRLSKPTVSAWAVNQLYWKHREEFDRLLSAGKRLAQAQTLLLAGEAADVRTALAARNEATSILLRLASKLLRDAGHNPSPDAIRRITTTLETLSIYPSLSNAPIPGRLTDDVAPLSFELLATLATDAKAAAPADMRSQANVAPQAGPHGGRKQDRRTEVASAEAALRSAEQVLREAQANADNVAATLEKAAALVNETEEGRRYAEERLAKARAAVNEARQRVHDLDVEAGKAKRVLRDAERSVERARSRLKQLGPI